MGTFTTKLKLGGRAYVVHGGLDPICEECTVGQICVTETLPSHTMNTNHGCYQEEYMCVETGVGSGNVWEYGKNIFATREEANAGVVRHRQAVHAQIAERDAWQSRIEAERRDDDLRVLARLKEKYEKEQI